MSTNDPKNKQSEKVSSNIDWIDEIIAILKKGEEKTNAFWTEVSIAYISSLNFNLSHLDVNGQKKLSEIILSKEVSELCLFVCSHFNVDIKNLQNVGQIFRDFLINLISVHSSDMTECFPE
jgi:hypothetical protein